MKITIKTKTIPFDLETAKKIQAGDIEGNIRTERGEKVLLYKNDSILFKCFIHECRDGIHIAYNNSEVFNLLKLYLEVPDNEPQFKPFDKVLVRNDKNSIWQPSIFSYQLGDSYYTVSSFPYEKENIIPYEGNQYLLGTTYKPKED